jgi:hypothetical protein
MPPAPDPPAAESHSVSGLAASVQFLTAASGQIPMTGNSRRHRRPVFCAGRPSPTTWGYLTVTCGRAMTRPALTLSRSGRVQPVARERCSRWLVTPAMPEWLGSGDDGGGGLEHELAERCGAGLGDVDAA